MKTIFLLLLLSALTLAQTADRSNAPQENRRRPAVSIEEALETAKKHVEDHKIDVSEKYIDSVRLEPNPRGDRGKYWRITYELNRSAKGGQTFLDVYMDKSVEVGYGE